MKKCWTSVGLSLCRILSLTPVTAIYVDEVDTQNDLIEQEVFTDRFGHFNRCGYIRYIYSKSWQLGTWRCGSCFG